jgi:hypothetical protein
MSESDRQQVKWTGILRCSPQTAGLGHIPGVLLTIDVQGEQRQIVVAGGHWCQVAMEASVGDYIIAYGGVRDGQLISMELYNEGQVRQAPRQGPRDK